MNANISILKFILLLSKKSRRYVKTLPLQKDKLINRLINFRLVEQKFKGFLK